MQPRALVVCALVVTSPLVLGCKKGFGSGFEGEITMHIQTGSSSSDLVVKTKSDKMRFETKAADGSLNYSVFDPATNKLTMVMEGQKSYMAMDFSKRGTPQANTSPDSVAIEKSGKHETIAGVDCEDWTAKAPSGKRSEVCIASGIAFFDLGSAKSGSSGGGLAKELRDKKLFPLRSVEYDADGKELNRMEVTKIEKKSFDDSEFSVPKDYKEITLPTP